MEKQPSDINHLNTLLPELARTERMKRARRDPQLHKFVELWREAEGTISIEQAYDNFMIASEQIPLTPDEAAIVFDQISSYLDEDTEFEFKFPKPPDSDHIGDY